MEIELGGELGDVDSGGGIGAGGLEGGVVDEDEIGAADFSGAIEK